MCLHNPAIFFNAVNPLQSVYLKSFFQFGQNRNWVSSPLLKKCDFLFHVWTTNRKNVFTTLEAISSGKKGSALGGSVGTHNSLTV